MKDMQEIGLAAVGITAVLYVFKLSEYFEAEVEKARKRIEKLRETGEQNNLTSDAIEAQQHVIRCYSGKTARFILIWLPALILFFTFLMLIFGFYAGLWKILYFVSLLIPLGGAGIRMLKRPVAKYQEVIAKTEKGENKLGKLAALKTEIDPGSDVARDLSTKSIRMGGFALAALTFIIGFYKDALTQSLPILSPLFLGMIVFFLSSEVLRTPTKLWHAVLGEFLYYIGLLSIASGFLLFIQKQIPQAVLPIILFISYIVILILLGIKMFHSLWQRLTKQGLEGKNL